MKFFLKFKIEEPLVLPTNHNKILQAAILNWVGDEYSTFMHDEGYKKEKRVYKLYTFSNIIGHYDYDEQNHKLMFDDTIALYISFYDEDVNDILISNIEKRKPITFFSREYEIIEAAICEEEYTDCVVKTVSPITIHSTLESQEGKKKTYYYEPTERDFSEMIRKNLIRKCVARGATVGEDAEFEIKPLGQTTRVSVSYSGFIIRAWKGRYKIKGDTELIKMALLSGVGDRNSIGLGCVVEEETK